MDDPDRVVIGVTGDLDSELCAMFSSCVDEAVDRKPDALVIDMSKAGCIEPKGLAVLVRAYLHLAERDRPMIVREPNPEVRDLLRMKRLDGFFRVEPPLAAS